MTESRNETVTYLVANYNNAPYLGDCLNSLRQQSSNRWRALICDDGSTDASLAAIEPFLGERIRLLRNAQNQGYIRTLKRLITNAETDIVAILDADDRLLPEATQAVLEIYEGQPEAAFVYTRSMGCSADWSRELLAFGARVPNGRTSLEYGYVSHLKTFRRSLYAQTEGLDESMLYAEDHDLVCKLEEVAFPHFVDRVLHQYRILPGSQSHDLDKQDIGLRNSVRARNRALERRGIDGFERRFYRLLIGLDYFAHNRRFPWAVKRSAHYLKRLLMHLDSVLGIRSGGRLRRPTSP